jgi:benzylsuccinate CoA-transferase BbsF subunit
MDKEKIQEQEKKTRQALEGLRILDFGWALAGSIMTKLLADCGAEVIRVESVTRLDLTRTNRIPSYTSPTNPDDKPWFTHYNTSKYSMTINLKHPSAMNVIKKLIARADVIAENFTPGTMTKMGLDYESIRTIKPDIIMVSESGYGQTGPMAKEWGVDGTGAALSGYLDLTGWSDRNPVLPHAAYGDTLVPYLTATAVVAAVDYRRRTGKGQYIDASMVEVCVHPNTPWILDWQANAHCQSRRGNRVDHAAPHGVFPCRGEDKWCAIAAFSDGEWNTLVRAMGNPTWANNSQFATLAGRKKHEDELERGITEWSRMYSPEDLMEMLQKSGIAAGVVQTAEDILDHDPHLKERELFIPLEHPVIGMFRHPTPPFKLSKTGTRVRTSPCLGEHTEYICTKLLGMKDEEFVTLLQGGVFN